MIHTYSLHLDTIYLPDPFSKVVNNYQLPNEIREVIDHIVGGFVGR